MKRVTKISLVIVSTLLLVGAFSACRHHHDPEDRAQWMQDKVTKKLELNDTQQLKLKQLSDEMMAARMAMKQQFGDSREQLLVLIEQPTLDQQQIFNLIQSHTQAFNETAPGIVAALGDFYDDLNAEQQAQIREFMQEHRGSDRHEGY